MADCNGGVSPPSPKGGTEREQRGIRRIKNMKIENSSRVASIAIVMLLIMGLSTFAQLACADTPIIASNYLYSGDGVLCVAGALYKDTSEQDPNYDYYAIKVTMADATYANDPNRGPLIAHVRIAVSLIATETPANHQPIAGQITQQSPITFSYSYITFSAELPCQTITYTISTDSNYRYFDWHVDGYTGWHWGTSWVFKDWSDFNVGIRVPQGFKPTIWIQGTGDWFFNTGHMWAPIASENVYWVTLTAP